MIDSKLVLRTNIALLIDTQDPKLLTALHGTGGQVGQLLRFEKVSPTRSWCYRLIDFLTTEELR